MSALQKQIQNRKTFAIISHPDAGKTTLTEKLLLFGGAIQIAGAVKSNKIRRTTKSDFLEIEKQRGISVATSVMNFNYKGKQINLLDTPGHKDFAEDTYRTLSAVDSVILVIDCAKGVEEQTEKLMGVCRMRNTPVIIFINKLDREGQHPFNLLDEIEKKLNIKTSPQNWPLGMGYDFKGIYDLKNNEINFYNSVAGTEKILDHKDPKFSQLLGDKANALQDEIDILNAVYGKFDLEEYLDGIIAPVYFGSALKNFGVKELLDSFIDVAPNPIARETTKGRIEPDHEKFSGFVFKIHANLDSKHRDRIAFLRVCSGKFERNKFYYHVRLSREMKFPNPASFMAQSKKLIEEAYPGDVIGLYDSGNFKIGDTLTEGEDFMYKGIPTFSPEIFKEVRSTDSFKAKQLEKGLIQLTDEGLAQVFTQYNGNRKLVGTVGELQFDVIQYRLLNEYGASCRFEALSYHKACWVKYENENDIAELKRIRSHNLYFDKLKNLVFIPESLYQLNTAIENNPNAKFLFSIEHNPETYKLEEN
jgi:peptide chain release factor 3